MPIKITPLKIVSIGKLAVLMFLVTTIGFLSCKTTIQKPPTLFDELDSSATHIKFANTLIYDNDFNIFTYRNYYNGGGVGVGDINNDGLPDLFFIANMGPNKLYLNKGNLKFDDITDKAGIVKNLNGPLA